MVLITVEKDREWRIQEARLRFSLDASIPPERVPIEIFPDLMKTLANLQRARQWEVVTTVPSRKVLNPCCTEIATGKPGQELKVRIMPSTLQADTDDLNAQGVIEHVSDRLYVDNRVDWIVTLHFWAPALWEDPDLEREKREARNESTGFVSPHLLPKEYLAGSKRYK